MSICAYIVFVSTLWICTALRKVYVYEYDCFIYVHMCIYCVCEYFMALYSALMIPLESNCAIYIRFIIIVAVIIIIYKNSKASRRDKNCISNLFSHPVAKY